MKYQIMKSPVGALIIAGGEAELHFILFASRKRGSGTHPDWENQMSASLRETMNQLNAYFGKRLTRFDLPLSPAGTPFQIEVWEELERIPYGHVISYGELAKRIGRPSASRAVGAANGANPIPIVIPCHRVIGGNGSLTGYGGGLAVKTALLQLEGSIPHQIRIPGTG
jgi:methylated-DNA-[protein]-cysteine S-methyltransferase